EIAIVLNKGIKNISTEEILLIVKKRHTEITNNTIIIKTLNASIANQQFTGQQTERFGMAIDLSKVNPPHADIKNIGVNDFNLIGKKYFIRVSNSSNSSFGEWLISLEDFKSFES